jgi:hypothetical protein
MATFEKIAFTEVGSGGAASIDFSSIPSTFTDLKLICSVRSSAASEDISYLSLNGSTTGFSARYLQGNGSTASSSTLARWGGNFTASNNTASTFGSAELYFPNYLSSNQKSYSVDNVTETNGTTAYAGIVAGLWTGTAAINQITLTPASGNYVQYSTFTLYGIKKA